MARKTGSSGEKTANDLRVAATTLFARHGFAAVSMRQIATEIGVQAGALYLYTPDKQSLLFDLMRNHMQELLEAWETESGALGQDPCARLAGFVRFHIRFHLKRIDEVFIAYMELRNLSAVNFDIVSQQRQKYENCLKEILDHGVETKAFDLLDAKLATFSIIAMLTGINTWFHDDGRLDSSRVEDIYLDLVQGIVGCKIRVRP